MMKEINCLIIISLIFLTWLTTSNSIFAQNISNEIEDNSNISKKIMSGSLNLVKMHLEEAIKNLEVGNREAASIHLNAGYQTVSNMSLEAKEFYQAGMKALSTGDLKGALDSLKIADMKLLAKS